MKKKVLVTWTVFVFTILLVVGSAAKKKDKFDFYVPTAKEEISGTWVNMDYGRQMYPQKIVNYYWGSYDLFLKTADTNPTNKGANTIVAKWVDKEGNTWFKQYYREDWTPDIYFELDRISNNGTVWEYCFNLYNFPTEDDVKSKNATQNYRIYHRQ